MHLWLSHTACKGPWTRVQASVHWYRHLQNHIFKYRLVHLFAGLYIYFQTCMCIFRLVHLFADLYVFSQTFICIYRLVHIFSDLYIYLQTFKCILRHVHAFADLYMHSHSCTGICRLVQAWQTSKTAESALLTADPPCSNSRTLFQIVSQILAASHSDSFNLDNKFLLKFIAYLSSSRRKFFCWAVCPLVCWRGFWESFLYKNTYWPT